MIEFLKSCNIDVSKINFAYCPERVLPGKILHELKFNDRIIGANDKKTSTIVSRFYKSFVKGKLYSTNLETAEMSKLVENSFRDVNIAFANEISLLCESQNIDYKKVIKLSNKHPRVSILEPGIGVGGHCIPVDPWFIISKNLKFSQLLQSARSVNSYKTKWISKKITNQVSIYKTKYKKNPIVSLFGLTYKANVSDLRESPSLDIFNHLKKEKIDKIRLVEPNVEKYEKNKIYNFKIAFKNSDILCFLVNHKEFSFLDKSILREEQQLLDFCGVFSSE
jgi:UDP-N-acetyl-D-mannosaminuronic acid dehydrogenase